ncbi:MAG TPA: hypothetical protein DCZ03_03375 [Gammaproteobacteria bacterium]|nr:hypothetical protein [Gammaproteobacteria bacterium]
MKFTYRFLLTFIIFCFTATSVWADISGVWNIRQGGMNMRIDYRDDQHMRMEMAPGSYLLIQKDKTYAVTNGTVLDLSAMGQQFEAMGLNNLMQQQMEGRADKPLAKPEEVLTKTNKTETIAGIKGEIYQLRFKDPQTGKMVNEEIVLTKDAKLVKLQQAMAKMAQSNMNRMGMAQAPALNDSMQPYLDRGMALLRYGDEMTLVSITETKLEDSRFELPKGETAQDPFSGLNQMMQQMMNGRK